MIQYDDIIDSFIIIRVAKKYSLSYILLVRFLALVTTMVTTVDHGN